jgi:alcohol dehydrogenase class IV
MSYAQFSFPTAIYFGAGVRTEVATFLKNRGFRRPLVVSDRGIGRLGFFHEFIQDLEERGLAPSSFYDISGNPVKTQVEAGVDCFHGHNADCIIGFGGGAALDVAKAIALMIHHPGDLFDYEDEKPGAPPISQPIPFWIALPTTSGTGSEVGRSSVISDDKTHVKKVIFSPRLLAQAVFADPELTYELPASITAATGMDALTHCVEAYLAKGFHPLCDAIALEGIRFAANALPLAVHEPRNLQARSDMMMASMMGAIAFQKGLGLTHSCAHALSTVHDLHHGLANGVMIDHALEHNISAVSDRFSRISELISTQSSNPDSILTWLSVLKKTIGIPTSLAELGITQDSLDRLSSLAAQDGCHQNNPRACSEEDFKKVFSSAMA